MKILDLGINQLDANIFQQYFEEKLLKQQAWWAVTQEAQHFIH